LPKRKNASSSNALTLTVPTKSGRLCTKRRKGAVAVSGLTQEEDHELAVSVLEQFTHA
jgi:uncharacterized protein (UPF0303 family)